MNLKKQCNYERPDVEVMEMSFQGFLCQSLDANDITPGLPGGGGGIFGDEEKWS